MVVFSCLIALKNYIYAPLVNNIFFDGVGGWKLKIRHGEEEPVLLLNSSVVTPLFVILHFKNNQGRNYAVILSRDSLASETFRQLRIGLKSGSF